MNDASTTDLINDTLNARFGFERLRTGQRPVIEAVLAGHSCAAIFPTGSGKSLCYQLPALMLPHLTLVISPLLALMKDQLAFLKQHNICAASIDSSQSREEIQTVMEQARSGELKILMISVERLKNERFRHFIKQIPISLLVVDEAHCISEWGHNFRPDYLKLPHYQKEFAIPQCLLLTATATDAVIEDMQSKFAIDAQDVVTTGFYRNNLDLTVIPCADEAKNDQLLTILSEHSNQSTIVYVTLQSTSESVTKLLSDSGLNCRAYHAGLDNEVRQHIQQQFMSGEISIIVATIAFGMGVDKADIRCVVHYDMPKSIENYAQEIGRAGRDGQLSHCILLGNKSGISTLENFVYGDTPERDEIEALLNHALSQGENWEVVISRLSNDTNIRQLPLKTLLVYMEMFALIASQYSYFADYRFKFIQDKTSIISQFDPQRQAFVRALFDCSTQAKVWCQVDFEALWQHFAGERQRAIAALDYFHQKGWIELESKLMTEVYRVHTLSEPVTNLTDKLWQLFAEKERSDVERIHSLLRLFESQSCLSHALASYFGDTQAPTQCGHCSVCRGQGAQLPDSPIVNVDDQQLALWIEQLNQRAERPLSNTLKAKFLCGISTPRLSKLKARSLEGFAKMESVRFTQVIERITANERL
ncbi:RecQ family ATP-dependent DNA helicase [Vibrio sp. JPW-9-11-11]|uniref:RecQ family ATP-dependent DNA helicase n=1 Tax=Vibrio sp. JPW-9-11-11 TaxID=1416532 RepID=UPI001594777C|nr:RecQ family ATP-dependent DNA helicase [Vibrio sp. JPW-9-11-11]NVD07349.1 RecQ family ATP-dependent DNA helicase [Vibrio sp. JPW-9-11-11]